MQILSLARLPFRHSRKRLLETGTTYTDSEGLRLKTACGLKQNV
jgi:hypothetical protein